MADDNGQALQRRPPRPTLVLSPPVRSQPSASPPEETFARRGRSAPDWAAARDRLAARRWIDASGTATERGRDGRDEIEWRTDRLADAPWRALGPARAHRLAELAGPILGAAFESGLLPSQSTLGILTVPAPVPRP